MSITDNKDLDLLIFMELDDKDLFRVCMIDKKTNEICKSSSFWKKRFERKYQISEIKDLDYLPPEYTWKDLYLELSEVKNSDERSFRKIFLLSMKHRKTELLRFLTNDIRFTRRLENLVIRKAIQIGYIEILEILLEKKRDDVETLLKYFELIPPQENGSETIDKNSVKVFLSLVKFGFPIQVETLGLAIRYRLYTITRFLLENLDREDVEDQLDNIYREAVDLYEENRKDYIFVKLLLEYKLPPKMILEYINHIKELYNTTKDLFDETFEEELKSNQALKKAYEEYIKQNRKIRKLIQDGIMSKEEAYYFRQTFLSKLENLRKMI